ncbi:amidohydrolase family protein [Chloroflexota bacterium]
MHIDIHCHFTPKNCIDVLGDTVRDDDVINRLCDPEIRIKDMDATGVDMQVLSPAPPSIAYNFEPSIGLLNSKRQNDGIAQIVKEYPDRFLGMATIPLQAVDIAITELDRAVNKLGLRGVEVLSNVNGRDYDSSEFLPFFKAVEALDIPIFIHPWQVAGADRMKDYHLRNLVGNPLDTTLAAAHIVFGGILDKCPNLKVCLAHAGGYVPYQRGRWEHGYEVRPESKVNISKTPSHYVSLLYFDTITHFAPALEYLISSVGAEKVVMGTDYPYDMGDFQPVRTVTSLQRVSEDDKQKILGGNAACLFKLEEGL